MLLDPKTNPKLVSGFTSIIKSIISCYLAGIERKEVRVFQVDLLSGLISYRLLFSIDLVADNALFVIVCI